jgi:antitoxin (DNA-binding transcriptional repressor) of toxin-antitoxin stability system
MQAFTYSEARQHLAKLLELAQNEEMEIRRRDGAVFSLTAKRPRASSPFDVPGIRTSATTADILAAIRESRSG